MSGPRCRRTKAGPVFLPTTSPSPDFFGGLEARRRRARQLGRGARCGERRAALEFPDRPRRLGLRHACPAGARHHRDRRRARRGDPGHRAGLRLRARPRHRRAGLSGRGTRAVPQGGVEGEALSPTQPFPPADLPALVPQTISPDDAFGLIPFWDGAACRDELAGSRNEGLYTPPSLPGDAFPFTGGGINWGGVAGRCGERHRLCEHRAPCTG